MSKTEIINIDGRELCYTPPARFFYNDLDYYSTIIPKGFDTKEMEMSYSIACQHTIHFNIDLWNKHINLFIGTFATEKEILLKSITDFLKTVKLENKDLIDFVVRQFGPNPKLTNLLMDLGFRFTYLDLNNPITTALIYQFPTMMSIPISEMKIRCKIK